MADRPPPRGCARQVLAVQRDAASSACVEPGDEAAQIGFTGLVGTQDYGDFTAAKGVIKSSRRARIVQTRAQMDIRKLKHAYASSLMGDRRA